MISRYLGLPEVYEVLTYHPSANPLNVMSANGTARSVNQKCRVHFDALDCLANNCKMSNQAVVSNRQRRNAQRAAAFRNSNKIASVRPVPVVNVAGCNQPRPASFNLPNNQVWVTKDAIPWGAKAREGNDAIKLDSLFDSIPEITPETKIFRLMIGFVAIADGTFGMVTGVTGDEVPDPPVVGRLGFSKNTYRCRVFQLEGKTAAELRNNAIVWCLDEKSRDAKRVALAPYWFAISRPAPLMPPKDFLVEDSQ